MTTTEQIDGWILTELENEWIFEKQTPDGIVTLRIDPMLARAAGYTKAEALRMEVEMMNASKRALKEIKEIREMKL